MEFSISHGRSVAFAAFNSGNFAPVADLMKDAGTGNSRQRTEGLKAFLGAVHCLAQCVEGARAKGFGMTPVPPTADALLYTLVRSEADFFKDAARILVVAKKLKVIAPGIHAAVKEKEPGTPEKEPVPPSPMEVRVVSMPASRTVQVIERDEETLEVISTTSVTSDLPVEPDLLTELKRCIE